MDRTHPNENTKFRKGSDMNEMNITGKNKQDVMTKKMRDPRLTSFASSEQSVWLCVRPANLAVNPNLQKKGDPITVKQYSAGCRLESPEF